MAKTKDVIALIDEERSTLNKKISEKKESDRTIQRARILLMSDVNTAKKMSINMISK